MTQSSSASSSQSLVQGKAAVDSSRAISLLAASSRTEIYTVGGCHPRCSCSRCTSSCVRTQRRSTWFSRGSTQMKSTPFVAAGAAG